MVTSLSAPPCHDFLSVPGGLSEAGSHGVIYLDACSEGGGTVLGRIRKCDLIGVSMALGGEFGGFKS